MTGSPSPEQNNRWMWTKDGRIQRSMAARRSDVSFRKSVDALNPLETPPEVSWMRGQASDWLSSIGVFLPASSETAPDWSADSPTTKTCPSHARTTQEEAGGISIWTGTMQRPQYHHTYFTKPEMKRLQVNFSRLFVKVHITKLNLPVLTSNFGLNWLSGRKMLWNGGNPNLMMYNCSVS